MLLNQPKPTLFYFGEAFNYKTIYLSSKIENASKALKIAQAERYF